MADTPSPPQQGSGAEQVFGKFLAKIGVQWDPQTAQQIKKSMDPMQRYIQDFNKTTDFKDSFFGKLPGIKQSLNKLMPDNMRFLTNMMAIGNASRAGADGMSFYNNNLGFFGKGLTRLSGIFLETGEGATVMGKMVQMAASAATFGIAALIAIGIALLQLTKNIIMAGIDWQEQLNDFNKVMGGVSQERLANFNKGLNDTLGSLSEYGFAMSGVTNAVKAYMVSGLNPATAMNKNLIETTMKLSEVTGEAGSELAGFFSGIMRGSKLVGDDFKTLGGNFAAFNRAAEASGVLGTIAFGDVKEAISSVGTALLIASNKSKLATSKMMGDLVALTGLAKALNISVSDLNGKFEEAGNLISSQESGFRAILAISGGANITNLLNNQFSKTEAMLKVSDKLAQLNTQFGGNLNILGQVAEQTFGLSKDVAIKLATMSQEQRKALQQAKEDAERMQDVGLQKSYESVTTTLSSVFERFKNFFITAFHRAVAANPALQNIINRITSTMSRFVSEMSNPSSVFSKLVDRIGAFVTKIANAVAEWLPNLDEAMTSVFSWVKDIAETFEKGGFLKGLGNLIYEMLKFPVVMLAKLVKASFTPSLFRNAEQEKLMADAEDQSKTDLAAKRGLNTEFTKRLSEITDKLTKVKKEENRLDGLKDTDIVVGKNGEFTLAGLQRLELATQEDALDSERQLVESQGKLQSAIEYLTKTIIANGGDPNNPTGAPSKSSQAPNAPVSAVAMRSQTYYGGYK